MGVAAQAASLAKSRISIIPIRPDGSKKSAVRWKAYQSEIAPPSKLDGWFSNGKGWGIAAVCGAVSRGLQCIDFDEAKCFPEWEKLVKKQSGGEELIKRLVITKTPEGNHVLFRSKNPESSRKLAERQVGKKHQTLIELRGEGSYIILPGSSPECPPSKKTYEPIQGDLTNIPLLNEEEHHLLIECAQALNEAVQKAQTVSGQLKYTDQGRPGDEFNQKANWDDILSPHGWDQVGKRGEVKDWRRPGKKTGISATTNIGGSDLFYNFSTNGDPFEAETAYSKFAAYTLLNHDGDYSQAAADLAEQGYGEETYFAFSAFSAPPSTGWPQPLGRAAYHGIVGNLVDAIEPHTEADPAALLVQLLTALGSVLGRTGYFLVEAEQHYPNLYCTVVGDTSKARKGTSWNHVLRILKEVALEWADNRIVSGLSSGEGLIVQVRDPVDGADGGHQGVADKRLLVVEGEFANALKVLQRSGNTLSPVIRNAWDRGDLNTLVKNDPARATDAHISIIGHITREELLRHLEETEAANGFGNRFLWVCATRSKLLPEGGQVDEQTLQPLIDQLNAAVEAAISIERVQFSEEARQLWHRVYPQLSEGRPGLFGFLTARSEAQVLRLSTIYALLDGSDLIGKEHLEAGLEVWRYCEDSCRYIFAHRLGDPVADEILRVLQANHPKGTDRTQINHHFKGHKPSKRLDSALTLLASKGLAWREMHPTKGRPTEVWHLGQPAEKAEKAEKGQSTEPRALPLSKKR